MKKESLRRSLSPEALSAFKEICKQDYGINFDDSDVEKKAMEFLQLFSLIYKPIATENLNIKGKFCDNNVSNV
ncbi:hypothetical protein A2716_03950 [candidate division WWE3 bacterium RIFCSPHIGHO2_01_FULL_40_23]|uniref:Uncharacterized protein n=1 Tax=candidate division WWE3 bacterium RIFCSPLOWO2_01_FULL_41_18 TaxID=1802625 RepID=A0A1F4VCQ0_UNCKA|nr:MAG: hypothetical protein A2716_03950 [candidate division WWE3 bacterium RIFCSPHIGHO2_01_FULL_40_23]OGC55031.1 MAG: hypothetical protein A3A78_03560 [candidate division WWE3 bacterium RIFCSPLOWO2_01_FULL_41_18]